MFVVGLLMVIVDIGDNYWFEFFWVFFLFLVNVDGIVVFELYRECS